MVKWRYTTETIRAGRPRPYADHEYEYIIKHEYEYIIKCEVNSPYGKPEERGVWKPGLKLGDIEKRISEEEKARAEGRMFGGQSPDELRKSQRDWAKGIIRALCHDFKEPEEGEWYSPTLRRLDLDSKTGTIRAFITTAYTD